MPPSFDVHDSQQWRKSAEEVRCRADIVDHAQTKIIMGLIAEEYERIADLTASRVRSA
jgi:hypothetical protein